MLTTQLKTLLATLLALFSTLVFSNQTCHPLANGTCTLPFPSNFYTAADPASPTGIKVDLKGNLFSSAVENASQNLSSADIYRGATGFSASAPVMIDIGQPFSTANLPVDGGNTVRVINLTQGSNVAIRTGRFDYAQNKRFDNPANIIEIFPRSRFQFGDTFVAVVTRNLTDPAGNPVAVAPGIAELIAGEATWPGAAPMMETLNTLQYYGIPADQIVSFTEFTITDEATNNDPLFDLVDQTAANSHPVRNLRTTQINVWPYAASVTGQIRLDDFRSENGAIDFHQPVQPKHYWADFILMLPIASLYGSAPVAIYGHGLGTIKESMLATVAYPNAAKGIASIVIDQPNHGSRARDDGGNLQDILNPDNILRVTSIVTQSTLDMVSVLKALQTSLATLDVIPARNNWWTRLWYRGGINTPDIDSNNIVYQGTSMGGVLGTSFVATAPDVRQAFLQVTGVGISNILTHSILFESFGFENLLPDVATAGEAALFIQAIQQSVDHGDAINFAHYVRNPVYGREPRGLVVQYGIGDEVVFNASSEALAELVDLPLSGRVLEPVEFLNTSPGYEDGYGLVQNRPLLFTKGALDPLLAHASFIRPDSIAALKSWADQFVLNP